MATQFYYDKVRIMHTGVEPKLLFLLIFPCHRIQHLNGGDVRYENVTIFIKRKCTARKKTFPPLLVIQELINLSQPLFTLRKKNILVRQGATFKGLYIVHCGMLKQTLERKCEIDLLTHFFLPGDIIGLDAIGDSSYSGTVSAIETSGLLHIPFKHIEEIPCTQKSHMQLLRCLSRAMHQEHSRMRQIINQPSDVRLAHFFIAMSHNFHTRGYSPYFFRLAMSRQEIAHYLCMSSETVSRLIKRFKDEQLLSASGHEYYILNPEGLTRVADR